jgi:hypothetical protein
VVEDYATQKKLDQYHTRRVEKLRAEHAARDAAEWAEVDALTDRAAQARAVSRHPQDFGAAVEWDGVDPGPGHF